MTGVGARRAIRKSHEAIQRAELRLRDKLQRGQAVCPASPVGCPVRVAIYHPGGPVSQGREGAGTVSHCWDTCPYTTTAAGAPGYGEDFSLALLSEKMTCVGRTVFPWGYALPPASRGYPAGGVNSNLNSIKSLPPSTQDVPYPPFCGTGTRLPAPSPSPAERGNRNSANSLSAYGVPQPAIGHAPILGIASPRLLPF